MAKYQCSQCNYQTNNKRNYNMHVNRKNPCRIDKPHKLIKENKQTKCPICLKHFSREDNLKKHMRKHNGTATNNNSTKGDSNSTAGIAGDENTTNMHSYNTTNVNNPVIHQTIIKKYDTYDINDLTVYEQYLCLTAKDSPYTALLDHLNLNPTREQYHNMRYNDFHSNKMDVHTGEQWMKTLASEALGSIVSQERIAIGFIFNRFRIFLSNKRTKLTAEAYYYGHRQVYRLHKFMVEQVKMHLYNYRKTKKVIKEQIPDKNSGVWWALSKNFTWAEVEEYINKLDKYGIDLDHELVRVKAEILALCQRKPRLKDFFRKLLARIKDRMKVVHWDDLDESSEEVIMGSEEEKFDGVLPEVDNNMRGVAKCN